MELDATVEALAPRLLRYCLGRTGSAEAAEEVAQDALAALVGRWRRHGPPESPEAFAFAVARRRAWRLVVRRRLLLPLSAMNDGRGVGAEARASIGEGPAAELDLEARTLVRAEVARALAALRRLPDRDREAILLVSAAELGTEEAAGIVGVSRSAFKMRVHRARKRLIGLLAAMGVLVVALTGWLVLSLRPGGPPPAEPRAARYTLTNRNGVLIVRKPDGGASFLHTRERLDEPPRGMMLIVQGEDRP